MTQFDNTEGLFHVYVVPSIPAGSGEAPRRERATGCPVSWARACQWVRSIMTKIGQDESKWFTDCWIEPAACPRPWTHEIRSAFDREQLRCSTRSELAGERYHVDQLHAELSRTRGAAFADAVRDGAV